MLQNDATFLKKGKKRNVSNRQIYYSSFSERSKKKKKRKKKEIHHRIKKEIIMLQISGLIRLASLTIAICICLRVFIFNW